MQAPRFVALLVGVLSVACSSSEGETTPASGASTVDDACAKNAAAARAWAERCNSDGLPPSWFSDYEGRAKAACLSTISMNGVSWTVPLLNACTQAVSTAPCGDDDMRIGPCELPAGTLANGTACITDVQCQSGYCEREALSCGVCKARIPVGGDCKSSRSCVDGAYCSGTVDKCVTRIENAAGGSCDSAKGETCQTGLFCDLATKTCRTPLPAGSACEVPAYCQSGLTCDTKSSTCVARPAEGQACTSSLRCQDGLACDLDTSKCVKIGWIAPGGDCSKSYQHCEQGSCNPETKKCPTVVPDGGACALGDYARTCAKFASCIDGKCALPGQIVCK